MRIQQVRGSGVYLPGHIIVYRGLWGISGSEAARTDPPGPGHAREAVFELARLHGGRDLDVHLKKVKIKLKVMS